MADRNGAVGPITLTELMADRRKITAKYLNHEVTVWYRPSAMTPEYYARSRAYQEAGNWSDSVAQQCSEIIIEWTLVDDQHIEMPHDFVTLRSLPNEFLWSIHDTAVDDLRPKEPSEDPSKPTSSKKAK